ncbi:hypothetical protein EUBDOL_02187 [Amedibacillus dolichus DSM 3991]|uniref:Uncharacterized protein n=1 Tax=Amedibacillus dolichus DSM 3991 TaxID=428127 RepID=A8RFA2_9FIRM|nr:hypothetical protein EUBDOL_02187 [Amedibacillus dolichus DSM 3991]
MHAQSSNLGVKPSNIKDGSISADFLFWKFLLGSSRYISLLQW